MKTIIRPMIRLMICLLVGVGFVATPEAAWAQVATATISGVVTDHTGAVVPAVKVLALSPETGLQRETETNQQGIFNFLSIPVGRYSLTAEKAGFGTVVKENLVLEVDRTLRVDVTLEVGAVKQTVEVVGSAPQLLKPETSDLGQVISSQTVSNLPLNGREFWQLALLSAGVSSAPANRPGPALGWRALSANGQREDANVFMLDGLDNRDMDLNQDMNPPNLDSIAEFAVHTNTYSVASGSASGALISVQTKSGTNAFHGTLFEFFRNDKLDAANFFANRYGTEKNRLRFNQYGGSIGGPIVRNKTFFFAEWEGDRISRGSVGAVTIPTVARQHGDFSDLLAGPSPVFLLNPRTFQVVPGNVISPGDIDPPAAALAALYPAPNLPGTQLNYATVLNNRTKRDAFSVKVDHIIGSKDTFSARFYYLNSLITTPTTLGETLGGSPFLGGTDASKRYSLQLSEIHQFSPTMVNDFRVSWTFAPRDLLIQRNGEDLSGQFGIPNITFSYLTTGLPTFLFLSGGSDFLGSSIAMPQNLHQVSYQFRDVLSISRGRHRIQVGGDALRRHFNMLQTYYPRGFFLYLGFSSLFTSGQFIPGADFADFLLGAPLTVLRDYMQGGVGMRELSFDGFFQDDIKVSSRLTLNLGVRYDLAPPWVEVHDRMGNFDPQTGGILTPRTSPYGRGLVQTDKNNFSPRVGFSYALTGDGKTLLRGGAGLFYMDMANGMGTFTKLAYNLPNYYLQSGPGYPLLPPLATPFPIQPRPPLAQPSGTVNYQPVANVTSNTWQWNLNLQREMPGSIVFEAAYVGTRGIHLPGLLNLNQPYLNASGQAVRPYPSAISGLKTWTTGLNSIYHGLQVKAERRLTRGVQVLAAYTFSKTIDENGLGFVGTTGNDIYPQNNYNLAADRGLSDFDVRHRFTAGYTWVVPYLRKASNPFVKNVLGGWTMNGITTLSGGMPLTPTVASGGVINPMYTDSTVTDIGSLRPNVLRNPNLPAGQRTVDRWFDTSAFDVLFPNQPHNVATFGNAGRNIIAGPGLATTDLSFFKEFFPKEGWRIQFRAEFFNIFNRVNLLPPIRTVNLYGGKITSSFPGREIQFGLKVIF